MEFLPRILPYIRTLDGLEKLKFKQNGGAFSIVDKCVLDGTLIARKRAKELDIEDSISYKMFIREVMETIVAAHPCIMRLIGWNFFFYEKNALSFNPVMATEFCEGEELKGFWAKKFSNDHKYIQTQKFLFAYGIAIGMQHLHNHSILHRDLKNENIFLLFPKWEDNNIPDEIKPLFDESKKYYIPIIADLGLAKYSEDSIHSMKCGTPIYLAPEGLKSKEYNFPLDVYAYAVILSNIFREKDNPEFSFPLRDVNNIARFRRHILNNERPIVDGCTTAQIEYLNNLWDADPNARPKFNDIVNYFENPPEKDFIFEDYDDSVIKAYKKYIETKLGKKNNTGNDMASKIFGKFNKYQPTQNEFYSIEEEDANKLANAQSDEENSISIILTANGKEKNTDPKMKEYISSFMNIYCKGKEEEEQHEGLSQFYLIEGEKSEKNQEYEEAEHFYFKSIQLGNLRAITKLGIMMLKSCNEGTRKKGIKLLTISSENKDTEGLYYYGYLISEGNPEANILVNKELGAQMLIESGQQGHPRGYYQAATIYHELGIKNAEEGNTEESRELLERSIRCYEKSYETYKDEESKRLSNELQKYLQKSN